ncbi:MAG: hypothetical protein QNJ65_04270 [Xenococcaceae cyanobacterium MO_234.B1]|nr:hypothetical protein [Xenococcaceae cyanobacterium MO_234.B1]
MAIGVRPINNAGCRKIIGKFPSVKMQTVIWWESQIERDYIYLLEIDSDVVAYYGQPFKIQYTDKGKSRNYTPDFLVERMRTAMGQKSLKIPHRSSIYRAVSNLEPSEKAEKRYGKRIAGLMYDPVKQGPRPTRPLERVEIDHTLLPMFVVDTDNRMPIGTPWLTSAVDKYSGITLGYYASARTSQLLICDAVFVSRHSS